MVDDLRGLDPSRKRVWRRFWKMTGIFLLILAGIIFLPWDVPAPNLADLTPAQGSIIPEEENAVFWFQRADALMAKKVVLASGKTIDRYQSCNSLDDQSRPMRDKNGHWVYDQTLMAESVKLYAEAFPFIDKGLACRQSSGTFPFSNALTRLLVIRSRLQMETGQHERAVDSTVQALQCGKWIMMHADQIFVIQYHGYGGGFFAPLNISLNRALQLVKEMELSNEQLLRLDTELAALNDSTLTGILRDRLPYEFQAFQKTCRTRNWIYIHGGFNWGFPDWIPAYGYKQNLTTRKTATIYRDMMSRLGQPWLESSRFYQTKFPAPKNRTEALLLITRLYGCPNVAGELGTYVQTQNLINLHCEKTLCFADIDALRLLIACKRYQRAQGRWPGTLQELVPAFLPAVPTDPFDGQPFRYDPGRKLLWSVGPDGKDDGGIYTGNMDPDRVTALE